LNASCRPLQPALGLCGQIAANLGLKFIGRRRRSRCVPWFAGQRPTATAELAQVIKAEIIQSGDLGLQRPPWSGRMGGRSAAIR